MMDLNSIVALAQAGFTREQIYQLANAPEQPQPQQIQQPIQQPIQQAPQMLQQLPVQMPQMMPQPQMMQQPQSLQQLPDGSGAFVATTPTEPPKQDPFMMLYEQMTGIKKAIQDNNIANSQITGGEPQSTDDILASIIQPTKPKEDK